MDCNKLKYLLHAKDADYQKRIENARLAIEMAYDSHRKFYASWSGGKDSSVMLRLILDLSPTIPVLYMQSGYALPETEDYILRMKDEWNLNLTIIHAEIDYIELCKEFGLPHQRTAATQKAIVKSIKKSVGSHWAIQERFSGMFWGLRAEESKSRKQAMKYGKHGLLGNDGILRVSPISDLSSIDIWAFIFSTCMPYNKLYDRENCGFTRETLRNTGWLSTDGENYGRLEWLRKNYPIQFLKVREMLP